MIYLDNNSTTKIDPHVLEAMMPFLTSEYGNSASNHSFGVSVNQAVKKARIQVSELIGCDPGEIIFTSGATESINLALKGLSSYTFKNKHIITVKTEHSAMLDTCEHLSNEGFEITYLSVAKDGLISLEELKAALRKETVLVSVMLVNNETGVIQPLNEISEITHSNGSIMMSDCTQAVGKTPVDVDKLGIDLMSFSAHKYHGPKGIGGLYIRSRRPNKVKLNPLIHGGGHERGYRSGTLNVPGIVGFGMASEFALSQDYCLNQIKELRDYLESELLKIDNSSINGNKLNRIHNVSNICFMDADSDAVMVDLKEIMVSNGSACTSTKVEPSHVLKAMGYSDQEAYNSIRFSLGKFNTKEEIKLALPELQKVIKNIRTMTSV